MTYQTNGMKSHLGLGAGINANGQIEDIAYLVKIRAKTADYTVLASESGSIFTNYGATAAVNFTLPTKADGLVYEFYCAADYSLTVTSDAVDTIVSLNDAAADSVALSTTSLMLGGSFRLFSDGTLWYAQVLSDGNTVTIAT